MARRVFPDDQSAYSFGAGSPAALYSASGRRLAVYLDEACTTPADIVTYPAQGPILGSTSVYAMFARLADRVATLESGGGSGGGSSFTHTQSVPATVWTINHALGYDPIVHVVSSGVLLAGEVSYTVPGQQLRVTFDSAVAGVARCG